MTEAKDPLGRLIRSRAPVLLGPVNRRSIALIIVLSLSVHPLVSNDEFWRCGPCTSSTQSDPDLTSQLKWPVQRRPKWIRSKLFPMVLLLPNLLGDSVQMISRDSLR